MGFKRIIKLAWPVMVGVLLQSLLGTIDLYFIMKLGTKYAAAASLGTTTYGTITLFSIIVTGGLIAVGSKYFGSKDDKKIKDSSYTGIILSLIIGIIIGIMTWIYNDEIIKILYNPNEEVSRLTSIYLIPIYLGMPIIFISNSFRSSLHTIGDTFTPLWVYGLSNIINFVLDPIFMFTFNMGIIGASLATITSITVATIIIGIYVKKKLFKTKGHNFNFKLAKDIMRIGIWDFFMQIARPITGMIMFRLVYDIGKDTGVAAFGIGGQLFSYAFIILAGIGTSVSILTGHANGANELYKLDEIVKPSFKISLINILLFIIPYFFFSKEVLSFFTNDNDVIIEGGRYLGIIYFGLIFVIFPTVYGGVLRGLGFTFDAMFSSIIANVLFKLPVAYLLSKTFLAINGIWIAISVSVFIEAIIIKYFYNKKVQSSVVKRPSMQ